MTLFDTHLMVLSAAAAREDKLVPKLKRLPGASLQKVCVALVKRGLLAELASLSPDSELFQAKTEFGMTEYGITPSGLTAIGVDDESPYDEDLPKDARVGVDPFLIDGPDNTPPDDATTAPTSAEVAPEATTVAADDTARPTATTSPMRASLRDAAQAVLDAWDDEANREMDIIAALDGPMQALRAALVGKPARATREAGVPRKSREGTKQETVLALLRRAEGATIAQIIDATGWQSHTVRGFLAGLKRKGITVEVLERIRQVGPNKKGAKGSYSVYRVTGAGEAR